MANDHNGDVFKANGNFYRDLLDNLCDGIYFVNRKREITFWNKGAERLSGYSGNEVVGKCCRNNILMHVDGSGIRLCDRDCPLTKTMEDGQIREAEVYLHHRQGYRVPVWVRVSPIRDASGRCIGAVQSFTDNSVKVAAYQRVLNLEQMAFLDPLTEIGNRRYTEIILRSRFDELRRYRWDFGAAFIDIDHLQKFNDHYGPEVGDAILKMAAQTLAKNLRSSDFVGRWGGGEFLAVFGNTNSSQLLQIAQKMCALVAQSGYPVGEEMVRATVSVGAIMARRSDTIDTLIQQTKKLVFQSKKKGRNQVTLGKPTKGKS